MFKENSGREITRHQVIKYSFSKSSFFKLFSVRFEERFRITPFSWQISVYKKPNRTNKAALSSHTCSQIEVKSYNFMTSLSVAVESNEYSI